MARELQVIEGNGAGIRVVPSSEDPDPGVPVQGEPFLFKGKVFDPDGSVDDESDGFQFGEIKEVRRKNGKVIFRDHESQAVIEEK